MPQLLNRDEFEERLANQIYRSFNRAKTSIADALERPNMVQGDLASIPPSQYEMMRQDLTRILDTVLTEAYLQSIAEYSQVTQFFINDEQARRLADQWADAYAPQLASELVRTSQVDFARIASKAPSAPMNRTLLIGFLGSVLSLSRALMIGRTEITNVTSVSQNQYNQFIQETGSEVTATWYTRLDEMVCPVCLPRHGKKQGSNWQFPPPAHPNCRCEVEYTIKMPNGAVVRVDSLERATRRKVSS